MYDDEMTQEEFDRKFAQLQIPRDQTEQLNSSIDHDQYNDLTDMLVKQVKTLDNIFNSLITRGSDSGNIELRVKQFITGIRAQNQCVRTAQALKALNDLRKR